MSFSKRLEQARQAFKTGDIESSALAHSPQQIAQAAQERHGGASSQYIGDMVYGGLDGIVTTFAVVSGVAGAQLSSNIILIMGLANLFADGFSMAVGAYLSTKSEQEYYQRERLRETWEVEHFPDGERSELLEVYRNRGYSEEDAQGLVDIQSRDTDRWVDAMMIDELGMLLDDRKPVLSALATFTAFAIAGSTPLIVYILGLFTHSLARGALFISLGLSGLALFTLGALKVLVTKRNSLISGLEMLLVGGLAAGVAYLVGNLLKGIGS